MKKFLGKRKLETVMRNISFTFIAGLALILAWSSPLQAEPGLNLVGHWDSGTDEGTEVISVQGENARAALTNSATGTITILDLSEPAAPTAALVVDLGLASGEGATSVAFHPDEDYFLVAIEIEGTTANGRIEIRDADDGGLLKVLPAGSEPDAVVIDRHGRYAVVSNEAESFSFDPVTEQFDSPDGSVTIVDLRQGPDDATATLVPLADATGIAGFVNASDPARPSDERFLERGVDLNGDGVIDEDPVDINRDGDTDDTFVVGYIDGVPVKADEGDGELVLIPLLDNSPRFLEPELAAFSRDGRYAFVVLQENNGVAVIDVAAAELLGYYGLGTTTHAADIWDDGHVAFVKDALYALREPDGIAVTPDGQFFVTADEGDTDPKASKTDMPAFPTAGGRTVSVFDARTGALLGDTGNQFDWAAAHDIDGIRFPGVYPDGRSDSKGSEPENLVTFQYDGNTYAAVGLERADSVALVSLADPANPTVVNVAPVNPGTELGSQAPEGIGYLESDGSVFVYAANEKSGVVSVFQVTPFWGDWTTAGGHRRGHGHHHGRGHGHGHHNHGSD
jgi:DNA-binding beta-propeller fold protein YncE